MKIDYRKNCKRLCSAMTETVEPQDFTHRTSVSPVYIMNIFKVIKQPYFGDRFYNGKKVETDNFDLSVLFESQKWTDVEMFPTTERSLLLLKRYLKYKSRIDMGWDLVQIASRSSRRTRTVVDLNRFEEIIYSFSRERRCNITC